MLLQFLVSMSVNVAAVLCKYVSYRKSSSLLVYQFMLLQFFVSMSVTVNVVLC